MDGKERNGGEEYEREEMKKRDKCKGKGKEIRQKHIKTNRLAQDSMFK